MTAIKICGLSTVEHALAAARAGADLIGLVFAPSRRRVSPDQAAAMTTALRTDPSGARVRLVGLFVNEPADQINAVSDSCGLDYIQLSGDETPAQAAGIARPLIKALRLNGQPGEAAWLQALQTGTPAVQFAPCPLIVDAHVAGAYGGTGTLANWERAAALARQVPVLLAGGLTPENVAAALATVQPWGVDVSSGVERDGTKDTARIAAFIYAVRTVARSQPGPVHPPQL